MVDVIDARAWIQSEVSVSRNLDSAAFRSLRFTLGKVRIQIVQERGSMQDVVICDGVTLPGPPWPSRRGRRWRRHAEQPHWCQRSLA